MNKSNKIRKEKIVNVKTGKVIGHIVEEKPVTKKYIHELLVEQHAEYVKWNDTDTSSHLELCMNLDDMFHIVKKIDKNVQKNRIKLKEIERRLKRLEVQTDSDNDSESN